MKLWKYNEVPKDFFSYKEIEEIKSVEKIISDVRADRDRAVKKYTAQFDGVDLEKIHVEKSELKAAYSRLKNDETDAIEAAAENIKNFARKQKEQFSNFEMEITPGVFTGQKIIPIRRVGVYTPGGSFPLPSTVLMCVIPAKVAGVSEIAVCSPPTFQGKIHPAILVAADICAADEVYQTGGVQAIASLAYGTESISPVDKIVGPGNKYVTAAKKLVFGQVGIDFIAGPTELLVIADDTANPAFIAADLLGQAEHDIHASPILVTDSEKLIHLVEKELEKQLVVLATKNIAAPALRENGVAILVNNFDEAVDIANRKAPEHLELMVENEDEYIDKLTNYGSLFIGHLSAEALGDYSSGLNHTLPTNITARYTGGLSVKDFLKIQTTLRVTEFGLQTIGPVAEKFGDMEGLQGHARSVSIRRKSKI